jgi:hypothetical protein
MHHHALAFDAEIFTSRAYRDQIRIHHRTDGRVELVG